MASLARQSSTVSGGSAVPVASMAAQPTRASMVSNWTPKRGSIRRRTFKPSAMTSAPIPSPGRTAILYGDIDDLCMGADAGGGGAVLGVVDQFVDRLEVGTRAGGDNVQG